jgi:hypothetical protein
MKTPITTTMTTMAATRM